MKTVEVHPLSALLGAAGLALVLVAAGAAQAALDSPTSQGAGFPSGRAFAVRGLPTDVIRIDVGQTYFVPHGKTLVIRSALETQVMWSTGFDILVDGMEVFSSSLGDTSGDQISFDPGLPASAGSFVSIRVKHDRPICLLGYLIDG